MIVASTAGSPDKTQPLTLTVGAAPDYSLAIANPSLTSNVNTPAVFDGTLTSINSYASPVNLSCGSGSATQLRGQPAKCHAVQFRHAVHGDGVKRHLAGVQLQH